MQRIALSIEDDDSRSGGGFARLIFAVDRRPTPSSLIVTFKRGVDADPWLGPSGWQASEHAFRALSVSADSRELSLVVGPEVVNQVEAFTSIMAHLPELELYGVATWEATPGFAVAPPPAPEPEPQEVPFQLLPGGAIAFQPAAEDLGELTPPARMQPGGSHLGIDYAELRQAFQGRLEIDPKTRTARLLKGPGKPPQRISFSITGSGGLLLKGGDLHPYKAHLEAGETLFGLESAPLVTMGQGLVELDPETLTARLVEAPKVEEPPAAADPAKKRRWLLPLLVFLLIAGGTAAGLYLVDKGERKTAKTPTEEKGSTASNTTPKPSPKELYSKGQTALKAGKFDEARPLLRQAEAAGNREASLLLAQTIDSLDFKAGLFAAADDIEALRLYGKACKAGEDPARPTVVAAAKKDLTALAEALKIKADQGDAIAADTLRGPLEEAKELCK